MTTINLKPEREKSLIRRHPWIFSGAIARINGTAQHGETVDVLSAKGAWFARGAFSPHSQISVRIWTFNPDEAITPLFFRSRLQRAIESRKSLSGIRQSNAYRLVNSESDGLPGLIVDHYADFLVCQFLSAGAEYWKSTIISQLMELLPVKGIYERSDVDVREKEGLKKMSGILAGEEPPELLEIYENQYRFLVDVKAGHKTGFYLDQRDNRALLADFAPGAEVLNCFAYSGSFGVVALKAGASHVTNIESSAALLTLAQKNVALNGLNPSQVSAVNGDVFSILRQYRDAGRQFDLIVLDPPRFVDSRAHLLKATRGYKDINLLALKLLKSGGVLFTFSCSGLVDRDLFQKIVASAAADAQRDVQVYRWLTQATDHPTALHFPEGSYLKGLIGKVW